MLLLYIRRRFVSKRLKYGAMDQARECLGIGLNNYDDGIVYHGPLVVSEYV